LEIFNFYWFLVFSFNPVAGPGGGRGYRRRGLKEN
jgi:hypothetical protein